MSILDMQIATLSNVAYHLRGCAKPSMGYQLLLSCFIEKCQGHPLASNHAALTISTKQQTHYLHSHIQHVLCESTEQSAIDHYQLHLQPQCWPALQQLEHDIYKQMSVIEIIEAVLTQHQIPYALKLQKRYSKLAFYLRHDESTLALLHQLMQSHSLYFTITADQQQEKLLICDDKNSVETDYDIFDPTYLIGQTGANLQPRCYIATRHSTVKNVKITPQNGVLAAPCQSQQPLRAGFSNNKKCSNSLATLTQYGSSQPAALFYPQLQDTLLLSFIDGNPQQPIVISTQSNTTQPAIANNCEINGIQVNQQLLKFDDNQSSLTLEANKALNTAVSGDMHIRVKRDYFQQVQQQQTQLNNGRYSLSAQSITLNTQRAKLELTPNCIRLSADNIQLLAQSMPKAHVVRVGDFHTCPLTHGDGQPHIGGPVLTGSHNVTFNHKAAARHADSVACHYQNDHLQQTHNSISINGKAIAHQSAHTMHGGSITTASANICVGPADLNCSSLKTTHPPTSLVVQHRVSQLHTSLPQDGQLIYGAYDAG